MKTLLGLIVLLLGLMYTPPPMVCSEQMIGDLPCWETARAQSELNDCVAQNLRQVELDLNKAYGRLLAKYADDPAKVARIEKAQNAELDVTYAESERSLGGSVWPMCHLMKRAELSDYRAKQLSASVKGEPEGDVCGD